MKKMRFWIYFGVGMAMILLAEIAIQLHLASIFTCMIMIAVISVLELVFECVVNLIHSEKSWAGVVALVMQCAMAGFFLLIFHV